MAAENVSAPAPSRSDDQILPFVAWHSLLLPFQLSTFNNFGTRLHMRQRQKLFGFQLDEARFVLDANLLRDALEITPIDQAHQFVSPSSGDAITDFVNELGYPEVIHFVSRMAVNNLYQPWRAIFPTKKGRKDKPYAISYCRFTKLIICHLGRIHNIHQRSTSLFHLAEEDLRLGNLKFVPKGEEDEVFGMPISSELISNNIRNALYYNAYLEMVAKHDQKVAAEKEGKKKTASTKQPKSKFATKTSSKPTLASKPKPPKKNPSKPSTAKPPKLKPAKATPLQKAGKGKVEKVRNVKSSFQLVDEPDEEFITFTRDQHLCFILLKKISDLVISNSFPKTKKMKSLECQFPTS
ncbi:hypothetical protein Tco_1424613 [Tanacetum coccineum]